MPATSFSFFILFSGTIATSKLFEKAKKVTGGEAVGFNEGEIPPEFELCDAADCAITNTFIASSTLISHVSLDVHRFSKRVDIALLKATMEDVPKKHKVGERLFGRDKPEKRRATAVNLKQADELWNERLDPPPLDQGKNTWTEARQHNYAKLLDKVDTMALDSCKKNYPVSFPGRGRGIALIPFWGGSGASENTAPEGVQIKLKWLQILLCRLSRITHGKPNLQFNDVIVGVCADAKRHGSTDLNLVKFVREKHFREEDFQVWDVECSDTTALGLLMTSGLQDQLNMTSTDFIYFAPSTDVPHYTRDAWSAAVDTAVHNRYVIPKVIIPAYDGISTSSEIMGEKKKTGLKQQIKNIEHKIPFFGLT